MTSYETIRRTVADAGPEPDADVLACRIIAALGEAGYAIGPIPSEDPIFRCALDGLELADVDAVLDHLASAHGLTLDSYSESLRRKPTLDDVRFVDILFRTPWT